MTPILASDAQAAVNCDLEHVEPGTELGRCIYSSGCDCACGGCSPM
jgi:hypothetical protein